MGGAAALVRGLVPAIRSTLEYAAGIFAGPLKGWYATDWAAPGNCSAQVTGKISGFIKGVGEGVGDSATRIPNLQSIIMIALALLVLIFIVMKLRRIWYSLKFYCGLVPVLFFRISRLFSRAFYKNSIAGISAWWGCLSYRLLRRIAASAGGLSGQPDFGGRSIIRRMYRFFVLIRGVEKRMARLFRWRRRRSVSRGRIVSSLTDEGRQADVQTPVPAAVSAFLEGEHEPVIPGRWQEMAADVVDRWRSGLVSGLLLEGGSGSGKSAFLNWFSGQYGSSGAVSLSGSGFFSSPVVRVLEKAVAAGRNPRRRIIMVDDAEALFRRHIGGFEPFRRFCTLVEKTRGSVLWVVSLNSVFSGFIRKVIPLRGIFPFVMGSPFYTVEEVMDSVEQGFRSLGYGMRVLMDRQTADEVKKMVRRKTLPPADVPEFLKHRFFNHCYNEGADSMRFHFYYLRRSLRTFDGRLVGFTLPSFFELPEDILRDMDILYLLHALYIHRSLSAAEISRILCFPAAKTDMFLSLLYEHTLLEKSGEWYSIFPVIYHQLLRYLNSRNIGGGAQ